MLALAGATNSGSLNSITFGNINAAGGTGGGGNVTIATATPGVTAAGVTINSSGAITAGNFLGAGTPTGSASIYVGNITTSGGNVALISSERCVVESN